MNSPAPAAALAHDAAASARLAFSVPERTPLTPAQADVLATGTASTIEHPDGDTLCWSYGAGPLVVLVHGWNSRGGHLAAFVAPLTANGHRVVLFDAPGHGASGGRVSSPVHIGRALLAVHRAFGPVHALIGHSAGSAAGLWAFAHGLRPQASVHLAGPSSLAPVVGGIARQHALSGDEQDAFAAWVERFIGQSIASMGIPALTQELRHPGLIVHDEGDRTVPVLASQALHAAWPASELLLTHALGHSRMLGDTRVIARSVAFIASRASGAQA